MQIGSFADALRASARVFVLGAAVALLGILPASLRASEDAREEAAAGGAPGADATAGFRGTVGFTGHNVFGDAHGVFHTWRVVEHTVDPARPEALAAVVEVELASVDTGNADRDEHLRTADFFDVAKHPIASVRGHSARVLEPSPAGHPRFALHFDVELHGVRKTVEGEIEIVESAPVVVEGAFTLQRTDFGVGKKPSRWNPMAIDDAVPVRFRIAFD